MLNLASILEISARDHKDNTAFIFADKEYSFDQINKAANQVANGLVSLGIAKGDKVAISCFNLPYFPIIYFGILKAGAVVVPLSVLLKSDEIEYHLKNSEAKAYFCFHGTEELPMAKMGSAGFEKVVGCEHFITIMPTPDMPSSVPGCKTFGELVANQSPEFDIAVTETDDTAVIVYTSGTTGFPKGAELSHSNLIMNAIACKDLFGSNAGDTQLVVLPLFHIFAMTVLMNTGVMTGACSVLLPRFDAKDVLGLLQKHEVSVFAGVPTMYWGLAAYDGNEFDLDAIAKNLRMSISGGASLPVQVLNDFEAKFNVPILEGYGMSEGSPVVTFNKSEKERKPGSIGLPIWGVEVKLVDADGAEVPVGEKGELWYRGHNVMKGYYNNPEATADTITDGWLHSGDIAIKDEDGFFFIVDRTKDMIIRGGLNVYPREVEEVIMKHDAVSLVAVIGIPDEKMGEEIKAFVVLKDGHEANSEDIMSYAEGKLAAYKYPRVVEFLDAMPMSATGKILKKELRKA